MDITCDQSCDMGYIYLQKHSKDSLDNYDKSRLIASSQPIEVIDNIYLKLNKLNWPDKKYLDALMDGDFIEEFQNDLDQNSYLKGIELSLTKESLEKIVESFKLATFEFNNKQYYYLAFYPEKEVLKKDNYVYPLSKSEDAFVILSQSNDRHHQLELNQDGSSKKSLSPQIAYIRAIIFNDQSPYDVDYLKQLKIFISNEDF